MQGIGVKSPIHTRTDALSAVEARPVEIRLESQTRAAGVRGCRAAAVAS